MEIHFYESKNVYPKDCKILHDWESVKNAIADKTIDIHTTQMCMLSSTLLLNGYRMFVHQGNGIVYEITIRSKENQGDRAVRVAQNVYGMWSSNVFRE